MEEYQQRNGNYKKIKIPKSIIFEMKNLANRLNRRWDTAGEKINGLETTIESTQSETQGKGF